MLSRLPLKDHLKKFIGASDLNVSFKDLKNKIIFKLINKNKIKWIKNLQVKWKSLIRTKGF